MIVNDTPEPVYVKPGIKLIPEHWYPGLNRIVAYAHNKPEASDGRRYVGKQDILREGGIKPGEYRAFTDWAKCSGSLSSHGKWWEVHGDAVEFHTPRYRVEFDRIMTPKVHLDQGDTIQELRTHDMDVREVFNDVALKEVTADLDRQFIAAAIGGNDEA